MHIVRRRIDGAKTARWCVRLRERPDADLHLLARESADGKTLLDYYVVPAAIGRACPTTLKIRNSAEIDRFCVRDLSTAIETVVTFLSGT